MVKFICISGKAGSGKDTLAAMMQNTLKLKGYRVLITHYADLLKFICISYFGWDGVKDAKGRTLLQTVGTDVVREHDPNFWVDFIAHVARFFPNSFDYIIIPDARFPNEIERLADAGFYTTHVRIERPGLNSVLTSVQQAHQSETALDGIAPDYTVQNPGDIQGLLTAAAKLCTQIINDYKERWYHDGH